MRENESVLWGKSRNFSSQMLVKRDQWGSRMVILHFTTFPYPCSFIPASLLPHPSSPLPPPPPAPSSLLPLPVLSSASSPLLFSLFSPLMSKYHCTPFKVVDENKNFTVLRNKCDRVDSKKVPYGIFWLLFQAQSEFASAGFISVFKQTGAQESFWHWRRLLYINHR